MGRRGDFIYFLLQIKIRHIGKIGSKRASMGVINFLASVWDTVLGDIWVI